MSTFTYIYLISGDVKLLDTLNYTLEEFKKSSQACYPNWDNQAMYATDTKFEYPIMDKDSIREMTKYEKYKKGLYELLENEAEYQGDILVLEPGQYLENGEIKSKEKIEGTKIEWNWTTHTWEDKTTTLDTAQAQYDEYKPLDTPLTLMDLEEQGLKQEYVNMMQELKKIIIQLKNSTHSTGYSSIIIPAISKELKEFKEKFKKIGG